jgi:hypothetical protein
MSLGANTQNLTDGINSITAGTGITITGTASDPIINSTGTGGGVVQSVSGSSFIGVSGTTTNPIITNQGVVGVIGALGGYISVSGTVQNPVLTNIGVQTLTTPINSGISIGGTAQQPTIKNTGVITSSVVGSGLNIDNTDPQNLKFSNTGVIKVIPTTNNGSGIAITNTAGTVSLNAQIINGNNITITPSTTSASIQVNNIAPVQNITAGAGISSSITNNNATLTNTAPVQNITAGAGISSTITANNATLANTGVLSLIAGSGITVSGATGNITVSSAAAAAPPIVAYANPTWNPQTSTGANISPLALANGAGVSLVSLGINPVNYNFIEVSCGISAMAALNTVYWGCYAQANDGTQQPNPQGDAEYYLTTQQQNMYFRYIMSKAKGEFKNTSTSINMYVYVIGPFPNGFVVMNSPSFNMGFRAFN